MFQYFSFFVKTQELVLTTTHFVDIHLPSLAARVDVDFLFFFSLRNKVEHNRESANWLGLVIKAQFSLRSQKVQQKVHVVKYISSF